MDQVQAKQQTYKYLYMFLVQEMRTQMERQAVRQTLNKYFKQLKHALCWLNKYKEILEERT